VVGIAGTLLFGAGVAVSITGFVGFERRDLTPERQSFWQTVFRWPRRVRVP
jgi:hypothetical protein